MKNNRGGGEGGLKREGVLASPEKRRAYMRGGFIEDLQYDLLVTSSDALPLRQQETCDS